MHLFSAHKKRREIVSSLIFFLFFAAACFGDDTRGMTREKITFVPANIAITAERPVTDEAVMKGLMFRTFLGEKEGMIFYFKTTDRHAFWMFNTKIPLEIFFIDEKLNIVDIQEMEPCRERDSAACPHYAAKKPARYAIEVNRGFSKRHGIHVGDRVRIDR